MEISVTPQSPWLDLSPARWIWFPSQRTLPNTFILFRHEVSLPEKPLKAAGFICADSRYRLTVNGMRVQWGPAPCDPRQMEADPLDLEPYLQSGENVIGVEVLYYGFGDGTWPGGKSGFIFNLQIELPSGKDISVVSDLSWQAFLDRAHKPGQFKRWFLRALQEEYDARIAPQGWNQNGFIPDSRWLPAMELDCPPSDPPICSTYPDYLNDSYTSAGATTDTLLLTGGVQVGLRARQIPMMREIPVAALRLAESGRVKWLRDPLDWFEYRTPGSFELIRLPVAEQRGENTWVLPEASGDSATYAIFEFSEQIVGFPFFTIDAPEGTVVELITQESHDPTLTGWLDTHYFTWSRFVCREGLNSFENFDYESLRWMQLHIHNASRPVMLSSIGIRRRLFAWPNESAMRTSDPALQRLLDASLNTLCNSAQEIIVDGMGRERQQTSGDVAHQLQAIRYAYGETRLPARYLRTYSSSQTEAGYFLDWPCCDMPTRISQKLVGAGFWGPILDHSIQFVFEGWNHYLETGDLEALHEPYPRFLRFAAYLEHLRGEDGLLPVENLGIPYVWMDTPSAYHQQRHKQCAFNLYAAAMFEHALAPLQHAFEDKEEADRSRQIGQEILGATIDRYWSQELGLFVHNLPWLAEEKAPRFCDRSLANAVLFNQVPSGNYAAIRKILVDCPPELGLSFPANAGWRLHAMSYLGLGNAVLRDLRQHWAKMDSILLNNTIQEGWHARPDTTDQWSHAAVVPTYVFFMDIAGITPLEPGFARVQVRPQLGDLDTLALTAHTVRGPIGFSAKKVGDQHEITISLPTGCTGELVLAAGNKPALPLLSSSAKSGLESYMLEAGRQITILIYV